jgi:predicted  nucleic acid-binding Zn-ribbon protein
MRTCDWTGRESDGKHYLLNTTEGREEVSAEAFTAGVSEEDHDALAQRVATLERRLAVVEKRLVEVLSPEKDGQEEDGQEEESAESSERAPKAPRKRAASHHG